MTDYAAWNANVKSWRRKLRTAKTKANNIEPKRSDFQRTLTPEYAEALAKVARVAADAMNDWDNNGIPYPDYWHEFQRAEEDAINALARERVMHL